jgi:hypothetical protein
LLVKRPGNGVLAVKWALKNAEHRRQLRRIGAVV